MLFTETNVAGAYAIEIEPMRDERGFFARSWCAEEYAANGLDPRVAQCGVSWNEHKGTLRGMHYQAPPFAEAKTVRCTRGAIFDVIVDLRLHSATYKRWSGTTLSADSRLMLYVPEGVAHGFVTLTDDTEVMYTMSQRYDAASARGVRWDDPAFGIRWPAEPTPHIISARDRQFAWWREEDDAC